MLYILPILQYLFIVIKNWWDVYLNREFLFCNYPHPSLSSSRFFFSSSFYCLGLLACSNLEVNSEIMNLAYSSSNSLDGASANRSVSTDTGQLKHNDCGHAYMPRVGFELSIPVCEPSKTVRALDCTAIVIGTFSRLHQNNLFSALFKI
jgi:hypothetical protein